jgi:hypothetical protein
MLSLLLKETDVMKVSTKTIKQTQVCIKFMLLTELGGMVIEVKEKSEGSLK